VLPIGLEYKSSGEDGSVKIENQVRSKEIYTNTYLERERDLPLLKLAGEESEAMAREKQERDESGD
jgi:hypothetical protein